ncbi:MAG: hypothetical protein P8L18_16885 [Verrucomicrobiota bacterium]|nr:hypothetical protein [Verrucomicrobiota bacterium]
MAAPFQGIAQVTHNLKHPESIPKQFIICNGRFFGMEQDGGMTVQHEDEKICIYCNLDCSQEPRYKNESGQYMHQKCHSILTDSFEQEDLTLLHEIKKESNKPNGVRPWANCFIFGLVAGLVSCLWIHPRRGREITEGLFLFEGPEWFKWVYVGLLTVGVALGQRGTMLARLWAFVLFLVGVGFAIFWS